MEEAGAFSEIRVTSTLIKNIRDGHWFDASRATAYPRILGVIALLALIGLVATAHGVVDSRGEPIGTDFSNFWSASKLALMGEPAAVYDMARQYDVQKQEFGPQTGFYPFFYPPIYLLICWPLAAVPYLTALGIWVAVTGYAYQAVIRRIGQGVIGLVPVLASARPDASGGDDKAGDAKAAMPARISGKTLLAASEMKWVPMPGLAGAEQVPLWGDPTKDAHRILYRWAAGTKAPLHTHTHGDRGLVVSGTLSLAVEGAPPKMLPPGSWFQMAAGTKHVTAVEGDAPCVFYIEREGAFDANFIEAGAPAKH